MIFEETLQYKHNIASKEELPSEWKTILGWIGHNKSVLEAGCHTGDFSRRLKEAGCRVTGLEINSRALDEAKPFLEKAICGDLESKETWQLLAGESFEVILFEHVLEHLSDPWQILKKAATLLAPRGHIIIALPNISNAENRFRMLFGQFEYAEIGVMDKTHLRFFNQKTARELIMQAGLKVDDYASPWRVNPLREFIDHLPLLTYLRFLFPKSPRRKSLLSRNLTDVVMIFKCSVK